MLCTRWVGRLNTVFESNGLQVHDFKRIPIGNHMAQPWTEMQIMANKDFIENDVIPSTSGHPDAPSADLWRELMQGVEKEASQGLRLLMDIVYIVGQKN